MRIIFLLLISSFCYGQDTVKITGSVLVSATTAAKKLISAKADKKELEEMRTIVNNLRIPTVNLTSTNVDFYPTIQDAINANCKPNGGMIEFTAGKEYSYSNGTIPNFTSGYMPMFIIKGNGATIKGTNILSKITTGQNDAETQVNSTLIVEKLRFVGDGKGFGLKIQSGYSVQLSHCYFINFEIGLNLQFCLSAKLVQCHGQGNSINDFLIEQGSWQGATTSNSQSNATVFDQCRTYCKQGQEASFRIVASSGVVIRDCVIEGWNPKIGIDFDAQKSTTVKHFFVDNLHIENAPTEAGIKVNSFGGNVLIKSYWSQYPHVMIKTNDQSQGHIIIDNLLYIPPGATFQGEAGMWYFKNLDWQIVPGGVKFETFYKNHWTGKIPFYKSILLDNGKYEDGEGK